MASERRATGDLIKVCLLLIADQMPRLHIDHIEWIDNLESELSRYRLQIDVTNRNGNAPITDKTSANITFRRDVIESFAHTGSEISEDQLWPRMRALEKKLGL